MSSLQIASISRDFTGPDATARIAKNLLALLVMKGSGVRVPASALREVPVRQRFPPVPSWFPIADRGPRRGHGAFLPRPSPVRTPLRLEPGYGYQVAVTREVLPEEGGPVYVTCSFAYPPVDAGVSAQIWGTPGSAAESWLREVRTSAAFALLATAPTATVVDAPTARA